MDYIVRATAANDAVRAFAITGNDMVTFAKESHKTAPVVTAALGRMLLAGSMMGVMQKGEKDMLTLQIISDGPIKGITVTADASGNVKGFANNPNVVDVAPKWPGKLDVGIAVGPGMLRVIKDMGLKEPYVGTTELQTGEIAEDLTYYFAVSEQVPSSVGLGVLIDTDNTIMHAGGFIIQLMPFTPENVISQIEENLKTLPSVTDMLSGNYIPAEGESAHPMTPEDMLNRVLAGMDVEIQEKYENISFKCDCSREKIASRLAVLNKNDMDEIINDGKPIEVKCQFCNKKYDFEVEELKKIRKY